MWHLLIVDDEFTNRKLLLEMLKDKATCDVAVNGKEALDAYAISIGKKPYDAILLDIAMPEVDGLEVLQRVRESEEKRGTQLGRGIPIIMVTVHKMKFMRSFGDGCDDFIIKSVRRDDRIQKLEAKIKSSVD